MTNPNHKSYSVADLFDIVKYCALSNMGTYSAFELQAQANKYAFCSPEIVQQVLNNLLMSSFIYIVDSIPAPMYVTTQPGLWVDECADFFDALAGKKKSKDADVPSGTSKTTKVEPPAPVTATPTHPTTSTETVKEPVSLKQQPKSPVKPTNSTLTTTQKGRVDSGDIGALAEIVNDTTSENPEPIQSIKQQPVTPPHPVNKLKQRWYEAHKND